MKLSIKEVTDILQNEINWCLDHPDKELTKDQQMGFVNGLRQAQLLIEKAENESLISFADFINERPQLIPLSNVIKDLKDEDIQECIKYAAYLNYRRRVFIMANEMWNKK